MGFPSQGGGSGGGTGPTPGLGAVCAEDNTTATNIDPTTGGVRSLGNATGEHWSIVNCEAVDGRTSGDDSLFLRAATTTRIRLNSTGIGFFNATPVAQPTVTGATGGNVALQNLLTALANLGLIVDSTT